MTGRDARGRRAELDQAREYLAWYEPHRGRWVAAPIERSDCLINAVDYGGRLIFDDEAPGPEPGGDGH